MLGVDPLSLDPVSSSYRETAAFASRSEGGPITASILQTPPQAQSAKVALWRLGLEQAIAAIEEYRGEVRDLLVREII